MNMPTPFTLPTVNIVGGTTARIEFDAFDVDRSEPYDISDFDVTLSLADYIHFDNPVIFGPVDMTVNAVFDESGELAYCRAHIILTEAQTRSLHGKYIYQVAVKNGNLSLVHQGICFVFHNIEPIQGDES